MLNMEDTRLTLNAVLRNERLRIFELKAQMLKVVKAWGNKILKYFHRYNYYLTYY